MKIEVTLNERTERSKAIQTKLDWLNKAHIEKYEGNVECEIEKQNLKI